MKFTANAMSFQSYTQLDLIHTISMGFTLFRQAAFPYVGFSRLHTV